jgi:RHS repeat-associated protein
LQKTQGWATLGLLWLLTKTASGGKVGHPSSGTTQPIGAVSQVTYGSGDSDSFQYDVNTGRMKLQTTTVGASQSVVRDLRWNASGSLAHLYTTDPVNSSDPPTCNYTYDDLGRINLADCGSYWHQTFGFDAFGNITKTATAGISFQPTYNSATNRYASLPGCTPTYDANGSLTYDCTHTYTWDAEGRPHSIDSVTLVYDALNRAVEQQRSGGNTQIVYGPGSMKLALYNGQTLVKGFAPLPGGATAVYTPGMLPAYYRHGDWLGSSRLATTPARTNYYDGAYAPYGENHGGLGTTDLNFTGQNQDTVTGLYDFLYREYNPNHGRWISPDPAGLRAVNPLQPQTWNRYAYVMNNPVAMTDPLGLEGCMGANGAEKACTSAASGGSGGYCEMDGTYFPCDWSFGLLQSGAAVVWCPHNDCSGYGTRWKLSNSGDHYMLNIPSAGYFDPDELDAGAYVKAAMWIDMGPVELWNSIVTMAANNVVPGSRLPNGDVAAGSMAQQVFQGNRATWRNASGAANTAFVATGVVVGVNGLAMIGPAAASAIRPALVLGRSIILDPTYINFAADFLSGWTPASFVPATAGGFAGVITNKVYNWWSNR